MVIVIISKRARLSMVGVRRFQDKAFGWAEANKEEARATLSTPPPQTTDRPLSNLEDYLADRDWKIKGRDHGLALVSHVLSAPLTIRYCAERSGVPPSTTQNWCFLGARSESTLPPDVWKECLLNAAEQFWTIDLVGPDIRKGNRAVQLDHDTSTLTLRLNHQGYFHDLPADAIEQWSRFILLNPGLGHPNLKHNWLPTVQQLRGKSLWLSAHSALDAERDSALLKHVLGLNVVYEANPFCSRIVYQDPFDKAHFVSPNKFIALVEGEA
jgi:hypothetical protein